MPRALRGMRLSGETHLCLNFACIALGAVPTCCERFTELLVFQLPPPSVLLITTRRHTTQRPALLQVRDDLVPSRGVLQADGRPRLGTRLRQY